MKEDINFNLFSRMKDKRKKYNRIDSYTTRGLNTLSNIIDIEGFPENLDSKIFQMIKYNDGMVGLYKDGDTFVMCEVDAVGLPRDDMKPYAVIAKYYKNQKLIVKNNLVNDKDIVILYNNPLYEPEYDISRFADVLADIDNSMRLNIKYSRYLPLLRAKSDKEKLILESAIKAMDEGKQEIIVDDDLLADLLNGEGGSDNKTIDITNVRNADMIQYLSDLHETYQRWFFNQYGMYVNGSGKHAQQTEKEVNSGESTAWDIITMFLSQTEDFCERANKLYPELNLSCKFGKLHELLWHQFANECTKETDVDEDLGVENLQEDEDNMQEDEDNMQEGEDDEQIQSEQEESEESEKATEESEESTDDQEDKEDIEEGEDDED